MHGKVFFDYCIVLSNNVRCEVGRAKMSWIEAELHGKGFF